MLRPHCSSPASSHDRARKPSRRSTRGYAVAPAAIQLARNGSANVLTGSRQRLETMQHVVKDSVSLYLTALSSPVTSLNSICQAARCSSLSKISLVVVTSKTNTVSKTNFGLISEYAVGFAIFRVLSPDSVFDAPSVQR